MKKPIFSETQRHLWPYPEIEIAKLKFKREIEKSSLGKFIIRFNNWISKLLD